MDYKPKNKDQNLIEGIKPKVKKLPNLYFVKERVLNGVNREVLIVFVKSPSTLINTKDVASLQTFLMELENNPLYPKKNYSYVLIYIASKINDIARNMLYQDIKGENSFMVKNSGISNQKLKAFAYEWSELIELNKHKLEFMNDTLRLNKSDTLSSFIQEYEDRYQPASSGRLVRVK